MLVTVNGIEADFRYIDPYTRLKIHDTATANQHHMLKERLAPMIKDPPQEELVIELPRDVKIEPAVCSPDPQSNVFDPITYRVSRIRLRQQHRMRFKT